MVSAGRACLQHSPQRRRHTEPGQPARPSRGGPPGPDGPDRTTTCGPAPHAGSPRSRATTCRSNALAATVMPDTRTAGLVARGDRRGGQYRHDPAHRPQRAIQATSAANAATGTRPGRDGAGGGQDRDRDRQVQATAPPERRVRAQAHRDPGLGPAEPAGMDRGPHPVPQLPGLITGTPTISKPRVTTVTLACTPTSRAVTPVSIAPHTPATADRKQNWS